MMPISTEDMNASDPEVMRQFYNRLFPWKQLFTWLNHDHVPSRLFTHREFAFTLQGEIYLRYNSFQTAEDMKKEVLRLNPTRFEIGPIYSARPRDKKTVRPTAFSPQRRELVFDIDMTDYDEIRTCCQDKDMCKRCWGFIAAAVGVLDGALRNQFGYQHLLWVYSGRRGIHCWVSDAAALDLTDEQRSSIVKFLEVVKGGKDMAKKVNIRYMKTSDLHPNLQECYVELEQRFRELILQDQRCFSTPEQTEVLLSLLPDRELVNTLRSLWEKQPHLSSNRKWATIEEALRDKASRPDKSKALELKCAMEDIVLQYTYPRLDAEVSKHRNHLLKSPFCIHPGTNRVCVPVDPKRVDDFDPDKVPTVGKLLRELDTAAAKREQENGGGTAAKMEVDAGEAGEERRSIPDWRDTSMRPYVELFDRHIQGLLRQTREKKRAAGAMSMDF